MPELEQRVGRLVAGGEARDGALELLGGAQVVALGEVALAPPVHRVVGVRVVGVADEERGEGVERPVVLVAFTSESAAS